MYKVIHTANQKAFVHSAALPWAVVTKDETKCVGRFLTREAANRKRLYENDREKQYISMRKLYLGY